MKKHIAVMVFILAFAGVAMAGNVGKAQDFLKAGMVPQAIQLLKKEINESPTNAEAHFELGKCYVNQGQFASADERFASAVRLDADYGKKIGGIYKTAGYTAVDRGEANNAINLFNKAVQFESGIRGEVVNNLFPKAKAFVEKGNYGLADTRFAVVVNLDQSYKREACQLYGELGNKASDANSIAFYGRASQYCSDYNERAGNRYLDLAKITAKIPEKKAETEKYRKVASDFLGKEKVESILPDTIVYQPGEYIFELKAGEQTPNWITFPDGRNNNFQFFHTQESQYKRVYDDGTSVGQNETTKRLQDKFKIVATKNSYIKMVVQ